MTDVLTDDELVAIAIDAGRDWPLPLPTVNVDDPQELRSSAFRGMRSLGVRGALVDGEFLPSLSGLSEVAGRTVALFVYVGNTDGDVIFPFTGYGVVRMESGWLIDEVSSGGVHRFSEADDVSELEPWVASLLKGDTGNSEIARCLAVPGDNGEATVLVASVSDAKKLTLREDTVLHEESIESVGPAVHSLLAGLT